MHEALSMEQKKGSSFKPWWKKLQSSFVFRSWWMFLFVALSYLWWADGMQKKDVAFEELEKRILTLEKEKQQSLDEKEDLLLQIHSQNDPAWIQMTLMKELGVVPEGQVKVYFKKEE
jgi:hypothetical protein